MGGGSQINPESSGDWAHKFSEQSEKLLDWSRKTGCVKPKGELLPVSKLSGAEHRVKYNGNATQRWTKNTHPGQYGMHAFVEHSIDKHTQRYTRRLEYGRALPGQYLERLWLANEVFGDDIVLTAIIDTEEGPSVATTQPDIDGKAPSHEGIATFMQALGFQHILGGGPSWHRIADNILVIDAETWNFIETEEENILPFDVGIQRPDGELKEYLDELMRNGGSPR